MIPQVSILLCSYNQEKYLPEAIDSVLAQSFRDWELLLIDNGSTDSSPKIAERYRNHSRIRLYLHRENRAISARFNEGVQAAKGKFISFLYSDDFYLPDKFQRQLGLFEKLPQEFGVVYGPSRFRNEASGLEWTSPSMSLSGKALQSLLLKRSQGYPDMISPLTRRECFLRHPFDETIFAEGEAIFIRIALTHFFHMDPNPVAVSRDTGLNRGRAIPVNIGYHLASLSRLESDPDFQPTKWEKVMTKHKAITWRDGAYVMARMGGDPNWIRQALREAFLLSPVMCLNWRWIFPKIMSVLGDRWRTNMNLAADLLKRPPNAKGIVAGYGGNSGN
jgi:glycosyltransferase involved in cell wall biosynthesis